MDLNGQSQPPEEVERTSAPNEAFTPSSPEPKREDKPKKSKAPLVLGLLLVIALAACVVAGWMYYDQSNQKASLESQVDDKDKKISQLQTQLGEATEPAADDDQPVDSETDAIVSAATAYARAPEESANTTYEVEIKKQVEGFASVSVTSGDSSFTEILKNVDDQWVVIVAGQNNPSDADMDMYGIPESLLQ
ncbi:MAG TPA: hypothetical protein PK096_03050 [Candidatus Saccharibacteria bacterium]|nr:hypothetical protein [Candidatus Saccharibacteria bacterium]HRK94319.1 hypothetical protein [Candidatus Saccharibacteria bacterium]